jgi:hypothetical protein
VLSGHWFLTPRGGGGGYRLGMCESLVLRIFGHKRDEVTEEWGSPQNEELYDLYCLPYVIRVINSRRMRWTGHVTRMKDSSSSHRVW